MITPQAIKDQEFQIKFRGYDSIEVRAYLDLLADDVFELTEKNRVQTEEIETLMAEQEALHREKESLLKEVKESQENSEGIQSEIEQGYQHKDEEISELKGKLEAERRQVTELKEEIETYRQQISLLEKERQSEKGASMQDIAELEKLRGKVALLEEQNKELKQEGLDFKTTILAAQKFADNLRQTTQEEARQMIEDAAAEVERIRSEAHAELERYPKEIAALKQRKAEVRKEVQKLLEEYIADLRMFDDHEPLEETDLDDLFQSIQIPDETLFVENEPDGADGSKDQE